MYLKWYDRLLMLTPMSNSALWDIHIITIGPSSNSHVMCNGLGWWVSISTISIYSFNVDTTISRATPPVLANWLRCLRGYPEIIRRTICLALSIVSTNPVTAPGAVNPEWRRRHQGKGYSLMVKLISSYTNDRRSSCPCAWVLSGAAACVQAHAFTSTE